MNTIAKNEVWFITGSQDLYGDEVLEKVASHSKEVANFLDQSVEIPVSVKYKEVLTGSADIFRIMQDVNVNKQCIGIITWMHTFSPAKMWINGLKILKKPILHLHTQFNRDIPWREIDMDFMNLNQSAHGGREYGFILSRMRRDRKVVVGHWKDAGVLKKISDWTRAAAGWNEWQNLKIARFGDNMRDVAVTEGDKVQAELEFGYSVSGYGVGDLVELIKSVDERRISGLVSTYEEEYNISTNLTKNGDKRQNLIESARIELGLRDFLENGGFHAFTTNFEDLHGLKQLPGMAVQRLMRDGYGFGAEGDWKTSALVRAMKVMGQGLIGGTSFMEDYTYHLDPQGMKVLGAHMLEVCPSIGTGDLSLEVHQLGIGGKDDPVRLVFDVAPGSGINVSKMDMGERFRLLLNPCKVVAADDSLPNLPVARVVWIPEPDLKTAAEAWIHAGGAHHTCFSTAVSPDVIEDFAEIAGIELLVIDQDTNIRNFKNEIHWNDIYYKFSNGLKK